MVNDPKQQPDPVEKSLGDQATGADVSRVDRDMSLGDQSTTGDALSSLSDLGSDLGEAIDSDLPLIDLAARYEIEGELGQGGMGAVLLATDRQLKRKVAIKRILGSMSKSKTALQRFVTEAQSIAKLNHFNIVQVYDFGRDAEGPFLVLEYVDGGSLLDKLKDGKLEVEEAVDITCQLCVALSKAHGEGIIHRDIKPANILLTEDGTPKLTDFGLARQESVDHGQTQAGAVLGTIDFMPPEQRRDATAVDARSDLWSLAATLYQLVTGKSPKIINFKNVPPALQDVLEKALEEEPDKRYQAADEFGDALRHSVSGPVAVMAHGLQQGQCPSCHAMNELKAKFCESCQTKLREPCLNCGEWNGSWAAGCTQCGSSHEELSEVKRAEYEDQKKEVASLRTSCQFKEASEAAKEMSEELHWRLKEYQQWATKERELIDAERQEREAERDAAVAEARQLIKSNQLEDAVRVIEQVPAAMRNQSLEKLEKQIEERNAELLARIKELVKKAEYQQQQIKNDHAEGNYQDAISTTEALASYREPELAEYVSWAEEQLETLQAELSKWLQQRGSWLEQAQACYEAKEYTHVIRLLNPLPSTMASDPGDGSPEAVDVARLVAAAKEKVSQEQKRDLLLEKFQLAEQQVPILRGEHRHAQAIVLLEPLVDIDDPQLNDLVEKVRNQLSVIRTEFQDLLAAQEQLHAAAREFVGQHNYQEAVRLLEQIPEPIQDDDVKLLLSATKEKSEKVQGLGDKIRAAVKEKKFDGLLGKVADFLELKPDDPTAIKLLRKLKQTDLKAGIAAATTATAKLPLVEEYLQLRPADNGAKQLAHNLRQQVELEKIQQKQAAKKRRQLMARWCGAVVLLMVITGTVWKTYQAYTISRVAEKAAKTTPGSAPTTPAGEPTGGVGGKVEPKLEGESSIRRTTVAAVKKQVTSAQLALGDPVVNSVGMVLAPIPAGEFQMGSPDAEPDRRDDETQHLVKITRPFYLGVYEVTQEQYQKVMGSKPSKFKGPQNPVEQVSWNDAVGFCRKLSSLPEEKAAGYVYRLPTEAEWEYACRAGTTTKYSFGDSESELGDYAWYDKNSGRRPHPVGGKKPNGWGLYDMHGNVFEWSQDRYGKYPSGSTTDPTGAASGSSRVHRGGSWRHGSDYFRSATRYVVTPSHRDHILGFRVLRSSIK